MANTKSAKKNVRIAEANRLKNLARRTAIKTAIKKVHLAIAAGATSAPLNELLSDVAAKLARAGSKKVIHKKTASRKLSRLAKLVAKSTRPTVAA